MNKYHDQIMKETKDYKLQFITLNDKKINKTAIQWAKLPPVVPNWRADNYIDFYPQKDDDDFIQFLGISTAINAYYRDMDTKLKFASTWNGKRREGAEAMCVCIMRAIEQSIPILNADFLANLKFSQFEKIFNGDPPLPFLGSRLEIWHEVGRVLLEKYDGHFRNLLEEANYKCFDNNKGICEQLVNDFPLSFNDVRYLNGRTLPFHKKALLFNLIYYGRANDSNIYTQLKDPESISQICDYQVPNAQRNEGHTTYKKILSDWIAEQKAILSGFIWEVEIRLSQFRVQNKIHKKISDIRRKQHKKLPLMLEQDFPFWKAGREVKKYKHAIVPHMDH